MDVKLPDGLDAFLVGAGWGDAGIEPLPGDASFRRYFRIRRGEQTGLPAEMVDHSRSERRAPGLIEHRQQFLDVKMRAVLAGRALFVDAAGQRFHDAPQLGGRQRQPFGHGAEACAATRTSPSGNGTIAAIVSVPVAAMLCQPVPS